MHLYKTRWPLILAAPLAAAILAVPARAADPSASPPAAPSNPKRATR